MSLIRKKLTLKNGTVTIASLTIIKIGNTCGIKLILEDELENCPYAFIKTAVDPIVFFKIVNKKTEISKSLMFSLNDAIDAVIINNQYRILGRGGYKNLIDVNELKSLINCDDNSIQNCIISDTLSSIDNSNTDSVEPLHHDNSVNGKTKPTQTDLHSKASNNKSPIQPKTVKDIPIQSNNNPFVLALNNNFSRLIKTKLNELFTTNPQDSTLEKHIPNSKWVKIKYDSDEYYSIGILSKNGASTHLIYAVPGVQNIKPPQEAQEICKFLKIDGDDVKGYWLMAQSLKDGLIEKNCACLNLDLF
ncbi:MAG: hypothetical protein LBF68_03710 [Christensenellaceae bacterium]|jgi:hypothetical protein|nr:hypothetical protein [Christensenellaceae bacterium]